MSFASRAFFIVSVMGMFFLPLDAMARPSKEEKAKRRAAFWGLFSDLYRASGCLGFSPVDYACANKALDDALKHSGVVDEAVGQSRPGFTQTISVTAGLVDAKDASKARQEIKSTLKELMKEFAEASAPVVQPTRDLGKKVYDQYCSSCHGDGRGHPGKLSSKLKSALPAFNRPDRIATQFPFGVFAVMIHGTDDGEMSSLLEVLTVDELWAVAFYISGMPYFEKSEFVDRSTSQKILKHSDTFALSALAMSTDDDLKNMLAGKSYDCGECITELSYLRSEWPWTGATGRLSSEAKAPRDSSEARALVILLVTIVTVSAGFIVVLKRSGRVEK
jgi:mono/diheme cytochrome c family protein